MRNVFAAIALVALALVGLAVAGVRPALGGDEKVTLCHAAGLEGTTTFVTLTIAREAAFGEAGHFFENGTPRAGHEQDYLGPCRDDTTTTTTTTEPPTSTTTTTTTTPCPDCEPTPGCVNCPPTPPPPPRCPPGMEPTAGKDGEPGNDECRFPPTRTTPTPSDTVPLQPPTTTTAATETTPPATTTTTEAATPPSTPPASEPPTSTPRPKPKHPRPAKPGKVPPVCPVAKPTSSRCAVQGSG